MELLVKLPVILLKEVPEAKPEIFGTALGADQVYKVPNGTIPFIPSVGVALKVVPVQATAVIELITADGFTVITTLNTAPEQDAPPNG